MEIVLWDVDVGVWSTCKNNHLRKCRVVGSSLVVALNR